MLVPQIELGVASADKLKKYPSDLTIKNKISIFAN